MTSECFWAACWRPANDGAPFTQESRDAYLSPFRPDDAILTHPFSLFFFFNHRRADPNTRMRRKLRICIPTTRCNKRHRERQRTLAANARSNDNDDNIRGLGRLEDGVGYFPSLAALQFQSSIPGPSPSLAEFENREKERLNRILKGIGYLVLAYFLIS